MIKLQDCPVALSQKDFMERVVSLFKGDEDWFNRMCGIKNQKLSLQSPAPSSKPPF